MVHEANYKKVVSAKYFVMYIGVVIQRDLFEVL